MMAMDGEPLSQVAEWRLNSGGVFMRASDDEGGKLARLADVRDWLMHRNEWPMERAAEEIVKKSLEIAGELCIYTNMNHTIETL